MCLVQPYYKSELSPNIFQKFLKDQLLIQEGFQYRIIFSFFYLFPLGKECHLVKSLAIEYHQW